MFVSFEKKEGASKIKAMHDKIPESGIINPIQEWNNPNGYIPVAVLIMMLQANRDIKQEFGKSFMDTFGETTHSTANTDTMPILPGYVCELLSIGTDKLVAASHPKMKITTDNVPATAAQFNYFQKDAFPLHEITKKLIIAAGRSPKEIRIVSQ